MGASHGTTGLGGGVAGGAGGARALRARRAVAGSSRRLAGRLGVFLAVLAGLVALWEGFKAVGEALSLTWPFTVNDRTMPHVWDMVAELFQPSRRNGPMLLGVLLQKAAFTAREAALGFAMGATAGFALGIAFAHSRLLERGLMPYVVASQTIPILAIAPMVVAWIGASTLGVAIIAAYLTFFPVTINTLRGLKSADPRAHELMSSYAARRSAVLWKLRVPASMPYVFTALKIAAPASVVGAIIGELPNSIQDGLAGAILNFNQYYVTNPPALWATNIVAAMLGIGFYAVIVLTERAVVRRAPEHVA